MSLPLIYLSVGYLPGVGGSGGAITNDKIG